MSQACRGIGAGSKIPPEPAQDKRRANARQFRCRDAATDGDVRPGPEPAQDKRRANARQFRCRDAATDGDVRPGLGDHILFISSDLIHTKLDFPSSVLLKPL